MYKYDTNLPAVVCVCLKQHPLLYEGYWAIALSHDIQIALQTSVNWCNWYRVEHLWLQLKLLVGNVETPKPL